MTLYRLLNTIAWLWLWLSDVLNPVLMSTDDFWSQKAQQLFRLNSHIDDPAQLLGMAILPFIFWLSIDWALRRKRKAA